MARGDDILERLISFAIVVLDFTNTLPDTTAGLHVGEQLIRSATSSAANYAEARSGESLRDFIHKLGIVRKELNESEVWIRMVIRSEIGRREGLDGLLKECDELCRIICASKKTAEARLKAQGLHHKPF